MVDEDSLRGVTSNPAIFEKAILGSDDYDDELAAAARARASTRKAIYERSRSATCSSPPTCCAPVYDEPSGRDGFVSLEVAPDLAHDTDGTLEQARDVLEARSTAPT